MLSPHTTCRAIVRPTFPLIYSRKLAGVSLPIALFVTIGRFWWQKENRARSSGSGDVTDCVEGTPASQQTTFARFSTLRDSAGSSEIQNKNCR